jgi:glycosyltransferase involved in cell wall biosynthesis
MPLVTVIIPTYNRGTFIGEAVDSVLNQSFTDYEIVVVDDGSSDDTPRLLSKYGTAIRYFRQDNAGQSVARNLGISVANGRYVAFLDSDDVFYPEKLEKQIAFMEAHPDLGYSWTDYSQGPSVLEGREGRARLDAVDGDDVFTELCKRNIICTVTVVARKDVLALAGMFDPALRASEDFDLWLRLCRVCRGAYIPEVLTHVRDHDDRSMGTLEYHRDRVTTMRLQLCRWNGAATTIDQRRHLRRSLGVVLAQLGWCERNQGCVRSAGRAFWNSGRYGDASHRVGRMIRGGSYWAFPWIFRLYDGLGRPGKK